MEHVKSKFWIGSPTPVFEGYHDPRNTWNGFNVPAFEKPVVLDIIESIFKTEPEHYRVEWQGKNLALYELAYGEDVEPDVFVPEFITCEGKQIEVYFILGFSGAWVEDTPEG